MSDLRQYQWSLVQYRHSSGERINIGLLIRGRSGEVFETDSLFALRQAAVRAESLWGPLPDHAMQVLESYRDALPNEVARYGLEAVSERHTLQVRITEPRPAESRSMGSLMDDLRHHHLPASCPQPAATEMRARMISMEDSADTRLKRLGDVLDEDAIEGPGRAVILPYARYQSWIEAVSGNHQRGGGTHGQDD